MLRNNKLFFEKKLQKNTVLVCASLGGRINTLCSHLKIRL